MANETGREIIRRMQARAANLRPEPIDIQLGDSGPYRLPRCTKVLSFLVRDKTTVEVELETEKGQRIRIPIEGSQIRDLQFLSQHVFDAVAKSKSDPEKQS